MKDVEWQAIELSPCMAMTRLTNFFRSNGGLVMVSKGKDGSGCISVVFSEYTIVGRFYLSQTIVNHGPFAPTTLSLCSFGETLSKPAVYGSYVLPGKWVWHWASEETGVKLHC